MLACENPRSLDSPAAGPQQAGFHSRKTASHTMPSSTVLPTTTPTTTGNDTCRVPPSRVETMDVRSDSTRGTAPSAHHQHRPLVRLTQNLIQTYRHINEVGACSWSPLFGEISVADSC